MLTQHHQSNHPPTDTSSPKPISRKTPHPGTNHTHTLNHYHQNNPSTSPDPVDDPPPVKWSKTYRAGFINACVLFPTITALLTIFCYFLIPTIPWIPFNRLSVLIAGVLSASFATVIIAFFRSSAATYEQGNVQSYSYCEICLNKLKTRLPIMKQLNNDPPPHETVEDKLLREVGIKEAESAFHKTKHICITDNCYEWITGAGYAHLQQALYQAEEALIKVVPISLLISEAKHDQAALQDANISNNKLLSAELQQAIEDLNSHFAPPKKQKSLQYFLQEQLPHFLSNLQQQQMNPQTQPDDKETTLKEKERQARITIYYVRQILNDFRINRLFELVQQRSNLVLAIMVTGVITYILVSLTLLGPIQDQDKSTIFLAGTAYFFVGAAAGLFGRLYTISTADRTINSYGLPTTRTNAAAHLSGVAGVGGVFVTQALLQVANFTYPGHLAQPFSFSLPNLLISATFGLTPNLLIKNLQRQSEKSISDLESTKPSVVDKSSN